MAAAAPVQEIAALKIDAKEPASNGTAKVSEPASPAPAEGAATLKDQFKLFSKFGDVKSDGKLITLSQSDKWMKQAGVFDKKITTTDTGIHFKKLKAVKVSLVDYQKFLEDLAKTKSIELADIKAKLTNCGTPGSNSASKVFRRMPKKIILLTMTFQFLVQSQSSRNRCSPHRHFQIHRKSQAAL